VLTITISNNKGGSGKTTTAVSLAAAFGERGLRVLVIDLDPQGSATRWLGQEEAPDGLVEFSRGGMRVADLVVSTTAPGVDLIPTSPSLETSQDDDAERDTGMGIVRSFARIPDYWDLILIDTPPVANYLSLAPLVVSDHVIIPVEAHALAMSGLASVVDSVQRARQRVNTQLNLLGILACRVNATLHAREIVARLRHEFGDVVLQAQVREGIRIAEAPAFRMPITRYAPGSGNAEDYRAAAVELLGRLGYRLS
jgi:chromosome partitioning protein